MMTLPTHPETANARQPKPAASVITPQRITLALQGRWNPIRGLTPATLVQHLDAYGAGRLRQAALIMEAIEQRDIGVKTVVAKRKKAVSRLPWDILTIEGADERQAEAHKDTLRWFYSHLTARDVLNGNAVGGLSLLIRQMMDAQGKGWACHEVLWRPQAAGRLAAELQYCPLWWFEATTGRLRFLEQEWGLNGVDLDPAGWLVAAGDALMIPTAVAYVFKLFPLRDWMAFCEKFGLPGVIGSTDAQPGSEQWQAVETAVGSLINDWSAVKSKGDEIALMQASGGGSNLPFPPLIEYMDRKIAALWRGADLSTMSQGGESSGASLQGDEADMLLEDDAAWVEETLDRQLSRAVIQHIHGDAEPLAYLKLSTPKKRQVDADDKAIRLCLEAGIALGVDATRERLGLPKPDEDEDLLTTTAPKTPQDAPGAPGGIETSNAGLSRELMPVKGQGVDSGKGLSEEFLLASRELFGRALEQDLAPLRTRMEAIAGIEDPEIRRGRLAALLAEWDRLTADLTADPQAAQALSQVTGAAMAEGLAAAPVVANAGTSGGAKKGWHTRRHGAPPEDLDRRLELGRQAMDRVIRLQRDEPAAVTREETGPVDFRYGKPGTPPHFSDGYGVSHIIAKRNHEAVTDPEFRGQTGTHVARAMVETLLRGDVGMPYEQGNKMAITLGNSTAVLSRNFRGEGNAWLLSGFLERKKAR